MRPRVGVSWWGRKPHLYAVTSETVTPGKRKRDRSTGRPLRTTIIVLAIVGGALGLIAGALTGPLGALLAGVALGVGVALVAVIRQRRRP